MADKIDLNKKYCVAFGMFDGVHSGHEALLEAVKADAEKYGAIPAALTFDDHFFEVLNQNILLISTIEEKRMILNRKGLQCCVFPTTKEFLRKSAAEFWYEIKKLPIQSICVGEDFTFGSDRKTAYDLIACGQASGIPVRVIPLKENSRGKIASRKIRIALAEGDIMRVNEELGRNYSILGEVIHGRGEGHIFGFPTANIKYSPLRLLPAYGVYACLAIYNERMYPAVTNIGTQPTFGGLQVTVEAMIGDGFCKNIYGKQIELQFIRKLRDIRKFPNAEELRKQIEKDLSEVTL